MTYTSQWSHENDEDSKNNTSPDEKILSFGGRTPILNAGSYPFEVRDARIERNCATKYGMRDRVAIDYLITAPGGQVKLTQKYLASNHEGSRFVRLVQSMLGHGVGKRLDVGSLVGIRGTASITHYTNDNGDVYENVEGVSNCQTPETSA